VRLEPQRRLCRREGAELDLRRTAAGPGDCDPFNPTQQAEALALLEIPAWGDTDNVIRGLEICLRLALEATLRRLPQVGERPGPAFEDDGNDEFTLPREVIRDMPPEERLAYVARLLRSFALDYGVGYEFGAGRRGGLVGETDKSSPAALLRGLNDILWMPTAAKV
jgi:hypothetical protein